MISEEENQKINNTIKAITILNGVLEDNQLVDHLNETINLIQQYRAEREEQ